MKGYLFTAAINTKLFIALGSGGLCTRSCRRCRVGVLSLEEVALSAFSISWSNWSSFIKSNTMESKRACSHWMGQAREKHITTAWWEKSFWTDENKNMSTLLTPFWSHISYFSFCHPALQYTKLALKFCKFTPLQAAAKTGRLFCISLCERNQNSAAPS